MKRFRVFTTCTHVCSGLLLGGNLLFAIGFAPFCRAADIPVLLYATVESVSTRSNSTSITPPAIFSPGEVVTGTCSFNSSAVDKYPGDPHLGFYTNGLNHFEVHLRCSRLEWSAGNGLAQIENDNGASAYDRVLFSSWPGRGMGGSQVNSNTVVYVSFDLYEFGGIAPSPAHPLVTNLIPSPGYLLFDMGSLRLEWYEGEALMTTDLYFSAMPVPPFSLTNLCSQSNGVFQFTVNATAGRTTIVQTSTNLSSAANWVSISTNLPATNSFLAQDTNAITSKRRFFRAIQW